MRKKITLSIFILVLTKSVWAVTPADTVTGKKLPEGTMKYTSILKTNPFLIIWGVIPFTAEYRYVQEIMITPRQTSQFSFSYLGKSILVKIWENDKNKQSKPYSLRFIMNGYRIQVSHRFYLEKRYTGIPRGWYLSPHVSYATAKISDRFNYQYGTYLLARYFDMNLLAGKQKIKRKNFTVDYFFGIGYQKNTWYTHRAYSSNNLPLNIRDIPFINSPVKITMGFNMGYAFKS